VRGVSLPLLDEAEAGKAVYSRRDPIVVREIAGEHLLVPVRRKVGELRAIYALMGSAAPIFELLDGSRSLGEVRDVLVERFEVSGEEAWAELCRFVEELEEQGLVERRS
jgi:hypothetical protein